MGIDVLGGVHHNTNTMKKHSVVVNTFAVTVVMVIMLAGCQKKPTMMAMDAMAPDESIGLPTATITVAPSDIELGQSVVLSWHTTDATTITIKGLGPEAADGTEKVTPGGSTDFHLTATGDGGTVDAHALVTVHPPAPVIVKPSDDTSPDAPAAVLPESFRDVFFGYDSFQLTPEAASSATALGTFLKAHPQMKVLLVGYCDDRGSAEYNLTLGQNRADSVQNLLVADGIKADRIRTLSFGKEKQFCDVAAESCWHLNRRVQFTLEH
jgi:peptidoglycan-associated lipoprotein